MLDGAQQKGGWGPAALPSIYISGYCCIPVGVDSGNAGAVMDEAR